MAQRFFFLIAAFLKVFVIEAQSLENINFEISHIDSLLNHNKFELASKLADSNYVVIENTKFTEQKLGLKLQKAIGLQGINENEKALAILLEVINEAEKREFYLISCRVAIYISLIHEINDDFVKSYSYIIKAKNLAEKYQLNELYSTVLIRLGSIHRILARNSSKYKKQLVILQKKGLVPSLDSTMSFSNKALITAQQFGNTRDIHDAYFLLACCYAYRHEDRKAIAYFLKEVPYFKQVEDYLGIGYTYLNVSDQLVDMGAFKEALVYSDSAHSYYDKINGPEKYVIVERRAKIFKALNQLDSAYHYMQIALSENVKNQSVELQSQIHKLEAQYQLNNKEQTIQNRNRQLILALTLLGFILMAAVINIRKNRLINRQNIIINQQVAELKKTVDQKEILLSELQHRVKNNLQYVISLLEIQKESIGHSTVEDLIRSNQNRIHSIALLHKKLNVNENVDEVELKRYLTELAELVLISYEKDNQRVNLSITCDLTALALNKAMPVGLIIVELISNSMKHAFKNIGNGQIRIDFSFDQENEVNVLHYQDDGIGFDFDNTNTKGLGVEITKGLIDQLDAEIETQPKQGFDLKIRFK